MRIIFSDLAARKKFIDVSEERVKQETGMKKIASTAMLVSCLAYSSIPKMEVICSSETSDDFQHTISQNLGFFN
jgi:hypothetical protein